MILFAKLFLLIIATKNTTATTWLRNPNERGPTAVNAGTKCLSMLAKYYFHDPLITRTKNMVILHTKNLTAPAAEIELKFIEQIHGMISKEEIEEIQLRIISDSYTIDGLRKLDPKSITLTDFYTIVVDDFDLFLYNMLNFITLASAWNPGGRFLILFNNPELRASNNKTSPIDMAQRFFKTMYVKFNAANVVFCYGTGIQTYDIYITDPYRDPVDCETLRPLLIDVCDGGTVRTGEQLMTVLRGKRVPETLPTCTFKFCARISEPYIETGCDSGLEMSIIHILQDIMQFKIKKICTKMPRGEKDDDGKWAHLLGMIRTDECDFVVGGFFPDNEVHVDFGVTNTYLQDTYTWYVHLAPLQERWKGLITIFRPSTWLLFVIILIIAGIAWLIFGLTMPEMAAHKKVVIVFINTWYVHLAPLQERWKGLITIFRPSTWLLFVIILIIAGIAWLIFGLTMPEMAAHKKVVIVFINTWYVHLAPLQERWKGLITIFRPSTWLLFVIILIIAGIAWLIFGITMPEMAAHKKVVIVFINTWCVFLGVSANNRPEHTPLRVFFVLLAIYGLNVTTIYTSNLINVFTEPAYEEQIDSIEEIIEAGLEIGGREEYSDWFVNDNEEDAIISSLYSYTEKFLPTTENLELVRDGRQVILANRDFVLSNPVRNEIFALSGNVFSNPMEMITERGFPMLMKFNSLINRMKDSGLMAKIKADFIFNMTILVHIRDVRQEEDTQIVLTIDHLQGAFAIFIVGQLLSVLIFVLELITATKWFNYYSQHLRHLLLDKWNKFLILLKLQDEITAVKMRKRR